MRVFSYIVAVYSGFAPNPFHGPLTLACCKPKIRLHAQPGDIIVGLTRASLGNRVVYVARLDDKLTFQQYWATPRFRRKRPDMASTQRVKRRGDNIYEHLGSDRYRQLPSEHSRGDAEHVGNKRHDLGGRFVLLSLDFSYFGRDAIRLPDRFSALVAGRGHTCRFPDELVRAVARWQARLPKGVHVAPHRWSDGDGSWKGCS
jgi:hypothetical protein